MSAKRNTQRTPNPKSKSKKATRLPLEAPGIPESQPAAPSQQPSLITQSARFNPEQMRVLNEAASISGWSVSKLIQVAAVERAHAINCVQGKYRYDYMTVADNFSRWHSPPTLTDLVGAKEARWWEPPVDDSPHEDVRDPDWLCKVLIAPRDDDQDHHDDVIQWFHPIQFASDTRAFLVAWYSPVLHSFEVWWDPDFDIEYDCVYPETRKPKTQRSGTAACKLLTISIPTVPEHEVREFLGYLRVAGAEFQTILNDAIQKSCNRGKTRDIPPRAYDFSQDEKGGLE